ncbi:hypothetical protein D3C87_1950320 [compost metagenome]
MQPKIEKAELPNPNQRCQRNEAKQQPRRDIACSHQQTCKSIARFKFAFALPVTDCHQFNQNSKHIKRDCNARHIEEYRIAIHVGSSPHPSLKASLSLSPDLQHC